MAVSVSAWTETEFSRSQPIATVYSSGGLPASRAVLLNAHFSRACRSSSTHGALRPLTSAEVTVASASAPEARDPGAQRFHFMSQNFTASSYHVIVLA